MSNVSDREFFAYVAGGIAMAAGFFGFVWAIFFVADVLAK